MRVPQNRRRGAILILVLVVTVALSLAALAFSHWMLTERQTVEFSGRQLQARALAESGIESARLLLSLEPQSQNDVGGWYDNANRFCGVLVVDDELRARRGRFSLIAPTRDEDDGNDLRFGLEDESAKLNLNTLLAAESVQAGAGRQMLMALPNMTEAIADAILDWLDRDDEARENGAESDAYSSQDPPYAAANGPLETIEQLLLVRDVTPELLFGVDTNRNGYADDTEPKPDRNSSTGSTGGSMECGWARYLTLYSREANLRADGTAKINVNASDLKTLQSALEGAVGSEWATFILAYRQQGQSPTKSQEGNPSGQDSSGIPRRSIRTAANVLAFWEPLGLTRTLAYGVAVPLLSYAEGGGGRGGGGGGGGGGRRGGGERGGPGEGRGPGPGGDRGGGGEGGDRGGNRNGGNQNTGSQGNQIKTETKPSGTIDLSLPGNTHINSLLDLIGASVQVKYQGRTDKVQLVSPFTNDVEAMRDYLPKLMEALTTDDSPVVAGRININLAPRPVLAGIPGMPAEAVDQILGQRQKDPRTADAGRRYPTWLLTEGILNLQQMKQIFPYVTGGGSVFRAQGIGFYDGLGPTARIEAVFDATQRPVRVVFWRELTPLGRGYPLDLLGAQP